MAKVKGLLKLTFSQDMNKCHSTSAFSYTSRFPANIVFHCMLPLSQKSFNGKQGNSYLDVRASSAVHAQTKGSFSCPCPDLLLPRFSRWSMDTVRGKSRLAVLLLLCICDIFIDIYTHNPFFIRTMWSHQ